MTTLITHPSALQLHLRDEPRFLSLSVQQHVLVALQEAFGTLLKQKTTQELISYNCANTFTEVEDNM